MGTHLAVQLQAITVFTASANGYVHTPYCILGIYTNPLLIGARNRFVTEFLEVGGALTVMEILTLTQSTWVSNYAPSS